MRFPKQTAGGKWPAHMLVPERRNQVREDRWRRLIVVLGIAEQAKLRGVARGLGEAEMTEGVRGQKTSARGALQVAALDQIGLDDVLDGITRLGQRGRLLTSHAFKHLGLSEPKRDESQIGLFGSGDEE